MSDPNTSLLDDRVQKAVDAALAKRGNSGDSGGMDTRIGRIERDVEGLMTIVGTLVKDVAEIKGKISNLPTTIQLVGIMLGVSFGLLALIFAVLKFAVPVA